MKKTFLFVLFLFIFSNIGWSAEPLSDSARLSSYLDGMVQAHLDDEHIAGATVSVVKDGEVIFKKGYGYADIEKDIPVDPNRTLFRIGSVSKLFVWVAVMQLYEQGKLDLNADVNKYLEDFKIPETYDKPITLKHIMTHSAGFEDYVLNLFARDSSALKPLGDILKEQMPARVREPGTYSSYSNHATAIAAYIVEQISGMSFNEYIEEHILQPLKMHRTTFRQPIPESIDAELSKGYKYSGGELKEKYFEYVPLYPVGAASSTAHDMARFMLANMQLGTLDNQTILDSSTAEMMQSPAFRHHPNVNPMCYGFMDVSQNGVKIIGHGGDTFWFHTLLVFMPEKNLGLFVSLNSDAGGKVRGTMLEEFMDYYYPENVEDPEFTMNMEDLKRFEGNYRGNRHPHERFTKIASLMGHTSVTVADSSKLRVKSREVSYYVPVDSLIFRNETNSNTLVFKENESGEITHMLRDLSPIAAYEKVSTIESTAFHQTLFGIAFIIFLVTFVYWPLAYFIRKEYKQPIGKHLNFQIKLWGWLASFIFVLFLALLTALTSDGNQIVFGVTTPMKVTFTFPLIGVVCTLFVLYFTYRMWSLGKYSWSGRIHYTILLLALISIIWQANYWNLLGFQF